MFWNKRIINIDDIERSMELETRTQNLKNRIAELNRKIGRDPLKDRMLTDPKPKEEPKTSERDDELERMKNALRPK